MRRVWACCRHDFRRLVSTPRAWAVAILTLLFVENQMSPIRLMLMTEGLSISWPGLTTYMLGDAHVTLMAGLSLLMLMFDAPFTDETQRYIIARTGRGAWGRAQVLYVLLMSATYVLMFALVLLLFQAPWTDWSSGWSGGLEALVKDGLYETYDTMLDYDPWLMRVYTPALGMALTTTLHALAFSVLALIQYLVNALGGGRLGFLIAAAPLLLDAVIEEFFGVGVYYFSPVTLSRLVALDYGDDLGRPPIWYAYVVLALIAFALAALSVRVSKRKELQL